MARMADKELNRLHKTLGEGIRALAEQSEANGDKDNRARILFLALSLQLADDGILDSMLGYAMWAAEQQDEKAA